MKNLSIGAFACVALLASSALAGNRDTGTTLTPAQQAANLVARLTKLLDLTTAEQAQATTIFTTEFTSLATITTNLQTARTALVTAIEANDTAGITADATQIGTLTTQAVEAQASASAAFYAILTSDQQAKYAALGLVNFGGLGGPGRGGFGPGGPAPF